MENLSFPVDFPLNQSSELGHRGTHHYETQKKVPFMGPIWDPWGKRLQTVLQMWENTVSHSETICK